MYEEEIKNCMPIFPLDDIYILNFICFIAVSRVETRTCLTTSFKPTNQNFNQFISNLSVSEGLLRLSPRYYGFVTYCGHPSKGWSCQLCIIISPSCNDCYTSMD